MDVVADLPWLAIVLLTVASGLAVLEAAVPGLGLAGAGAVVLGLAATVVVVAADARWWPLLLVAVAVAIWTVAVGLPRPPPALQALAGLLDLAGGVGYGIVNDDAASVGVAVIGAAALMASFPALNRWTRRVAEQPPWTGMESLVGRVAVVEAVPGDRLAVRLDGSLWDATSPADAPWPTGPVVVTGWHGMALEVEPIRPGADRAPS